MMNRMINIIRNRSVSFLINAIRNRIASHLITTGRKIRPSVISAQRKNNPELKFINITSYIEKTIRNHKKDGYQCFLDVGGRKGEFESWANGYDYYVLDIDPKFKSNKTIIADICKPIDFIDKKFDVVFSNNVFEHLYSPEIAAENCIKLTRGGGANNMYSSIFLEVSSFPF